MSYNPGSIEPEGEVNIVTPASSKGGASWAVLESLPGLSSGSGSPLTLLIHAEITNGSYGPPCG